MGLRRKACRHLAQHSVQAGKRYAVLLSVGSRTRNELAFAKRNAPGAAAQSVKLR
ncbi:hypothetical protein GCM10011513_08130 [Franconibacter daqui]|nr:hypothetical protein GCM10011513_08130 [Franconibacter daqui]